MHSWTTFIFALRCKFNKLKTENKQLFLWIWYKKGFFIYYLCKVDSLDIKFRITNIKLLSCENLKNLSYNHNVHV